MFGNRIRRIFGDAHDVNFAVGVFHIDIVITGAPHGNRFDAILYENIDGFGIDIIVDESTDDIVARREFCCVGRKLALEEFERVAVVLIFLFEVFAIVGFGVENEHFHKYNPYVAGCDENGISDGTPLFGG